VRRRVDDQGSPICARADSPRADVAHPKSRSAQAAHHNVPARPQPVCGLPPRARRQVERVFEGDYAYFCHTGDGSATRAIYIVEFEPADIGATRRGGPLTRTQSFSRLLEPIEEEVMNGQFAYRQIERDASRPRKRPLWSPS